VFTGGTIWTGDAALPAPEALVVAGDRIAYVGTAAAARARAGASARIVDLAGRTLLPGLIDAHVHFLDGGDELLAPDLRSANSVDDLGARLRAAAAGLPPGTWLTSGSWDHECWPGAPLPTAADLDRFVPAHPVFVSRLDGHMAVANSLAIRIAGVDAATADPPGGAIVRTADGAPAGVFKDAAMALVRAHVPPWSAAQRRQRALAALAHAAGLGVTSVHDMLYSFAELPVYQELRREGLLTCRLTLYTPIAEVDRWAAVGVLRGFGDDLLRVNGGKGFADGSLGSTTAWFEQPYDDAPTTCGLAMAELTNGDLAKWVGQCARHGLQPAIHAIGDRANRAVLDIYAAHDGLRALRPRIEHAQHLRAADLPRFGALGVIASMQPCHAIDDGRWAEKRIGRERAATTYAFRSLLDLGAMLAFGTDWPVAPLSPWLGLQAAVLRRTLDGAHPEGWVPEQKITLAEALGAYTRGGAYAGFVEDRLGQLREGYLADLVVVDGDLFAADPAQLGATRVVLTMVGGRTVFAR
jgi:predicted amidohydrolase YtcJ